MNWHYGVRNGDIIIQTFPPIQNNGLHFLVKAKAGLSYKFSKRVAGLFSCEYQQGFSNFVTDYTHIYVQGYPQYDDKMYYTKVKGTAYQFHFGLRFYF
jgi:hypothetical protein